MFSKIFGYQGDIVFTQIKILALSALCLWGTKSNAMETTDSVSAWLDGIDENMVFYHSDRIIQEVQKNQEAVLCDLMNRIKNHKKVEPVLPQIFFTLLLEISPSFGDSLVESVCINIKYMCWQKLANSFEAFKMTMHDSDAYKSKCHSFGNKNDILQTLTKWLLSIKEAIEKSRKLSYLWNTECACQEADRINKLLEECKKLAEQHKLGDTQEVSFFQEQEEC